MPEPTSSTDRIERSAELDASPAKVWAALTDYTQFNQWFQVLLEKPFVVGQTTSGKITYPGCEHMHMEVLVTAMDPERYFAFRWHPDEEAEGGGFSEENTTLVEFHLTPTATGTRLVVTESGLDSFPPERRDTIFRRNGEGWTEQMVNIETHLAKQS